MKEAILFKGLKDRLLECNVCQRRCVIAEGGLGWCKTRKNQNGRLYSLIYGKVASLAISPIEKKPMYHFYPGSMWLSLGTFGCNFRCPGCQNYELSFADINKGLVPIEEIRPKQSIALAKRYRAKGISWTYNEPTIWFEYTLDSARMAKEEGLLTNYVTNGFITEEALDAIGPYLDSFRVDLKGFSQVFYSQICHVDDFKGILEVTKRAKFKWAMHVEIVTNVISGYSDDEAQLTGIAQWICEELGKDTPWHITQFVPHLKLSHVNPTPLPTLEKARQIGLEVGLDYVYIGNIPGHPGENTYCPGCNSLVIERDGYSVRKINLNKDRCPECGKVIAGRF